MPAKAPAARAVRPRVLLAACAALAALALLTMLGAAPARAAGCDTWLNTKGGSWTEGANWSTKAPPTSTEEACITEPGTYTVTDNGQNQKVAALTLGGTSGTQTLSIGSTCSVNSVLAGTIGIGAHGALVLTNADGCGNNVTIEGAVTNAGAISSEAEHGGNRTLTGSLTNSGTLNVNQNTAFNGSKAVLTNHGTIAVAESRALTASNASSAINGSGGKIQATGNGVLLMASGTSFTEGAGTTSGTLPVIVDDGSLTYEASGGEGTIGLRGVSSLAGASSAKQLLQIESTCTENNTTTASGGFTNGGSLVLTNGDGCGNNDTLVGAVTNTGTLTAEKAHGGSRSLQGNLINSGTVTIAITTAYNGSAATLTNHGSIKVAEGQSLSVSANGSVSNLSGGNINGEGGANVYLNSGSAFTEGAGTTTGTLPVILDDSALTYEAGGGESTIAVRGASSLKGSMSAKQGLALQSTCTENQTLNVAEGTSSAGAITLTNGDSCGNAATFEVAAGTFTNTGSLTTEPAHGGSRTLQGNIANRGTIAINTASAYGGAGKSAIVNEGQLDLAGVQLTVSGTNAVEDLAGGTIAGGTSGDVFIGSGGTYVQGAGTTTGTLPVYVDDGALKYTGSGESTVAVRGATSVTGATAAKQTLIVQSTCTENMTLSAPGGFSNAGTIILTNGDGCGNNAGINVAPGTLVNSGTLTTEPDHGGTRTIAGSVTNTGTINVNANTSLPNSSAATIANQGTIALATERSLAVTGPTAVHNEGGSVTAAGTGVLVQTGGSWVQGGGKTAGTQPVVIDDGALEYTGKGTGLIALRGTSALAGTINAGQVLSLQSTCGENNNTTAASFTSSGTIVLTNGDGCGNNVALKLGGGSLENKGTLEAQALHGGTRTIEGSVTNEKTVYVLSGATLHLTGAFTQGKKGTLKIAVASASSYGSLTAAGAVSIAGKLQLAQAKGFFASEGQVYNVLSGVSLTGTFPKETSGLVKVKKAPPGLYYRPVYSPTAVTLKVTRAAITVEPAEGKAGSKVVITGKGFIEAGGDAVKITFTDAKKVKTTFTPNVSVNASGEFTAEETLPEAANTGIGTVAATSTVTGVAPTATFKVV